MTMLPPATLEELLAALGELLEAVPGPAYELVICGGTAMNVQGYVARPTRDVDVVAMISQLPGQPLVSSQPLPAELLQARDRVARDFGLALTPPWLNDGPGDLLRLGLPEGFRRRLSIKTYGKRLILDVLGREDLICLKFYAYANSMGEAKHYHDLQAMSPTLEELRTALSWTLTQHELEGFREDLREALVRLGGGDLVPLID